MERLQPLLDQFLKDHPDMREEVAAVIGYAAGQLVGEDGKVGAAAAWSGTRFNWLSHEQVEEYRAAREKAKTPAEKAAVDAEYEALDRKQDEQWLKQQESGVYEIFLEITGTCIGMYWLMQRIHSMLEVLLLRMHLPVDWIIGYHKLRVKHLQ